MLGTYYIKKKIFDERKAKDTQCTFKLINRKLTKTALAKKKQKKTVTTNNNYIQNTTIKWKDWDTVIPQKKKKKFW